VVDPDASFLFVGPRIDLGPLRSFLSLLTRWFPLLLNSPPMRFSSFLDPFEQTASSHAPPCPPLFLLSLLPFADSFFPRFSRLGPQNLFFRLRNGFRLFFVACRLFDSARATDRLSLSWLVLIKLLVDFASSLLVHGQHCLQVLAETPFSARTMS